MGACDRAPVCAVGHVQTFKATMDKVAAAAKAQAACACVAPGTRFRRNIRGDGGYALLKSASTGKRTREEIIKIVSDAGLRGLGGAGFPPAANGRWCAPSPRRACSR